MDEMVLAVADITLGSRQTVLGAVATNAMVSSRILTVRSVHFSLLKKTDTFLGQKCRRRCSSSSHIDLSVTLGVSLVMIPMLDFGGRSY